MHRKCLHPIPMLQIIWWKYTDALLVACCFNLHFLRSRNQKKIQVPFHQMALFESKVYKDKSPHTLRAGRTAQRLCQLTLDPNKGKTRQKYSCIISLLVRLSLMTRKCLFTQWRKNCIIYHVSFGFRISWPTIVLWPSSSHLWTSQQFFTL